MKKFFRELQKDKVGVWSFWILIAGVLLWLILLGIFYRQLPLFLPIYNQLPWGYARLGSRIEIFFPFCLGVCWMLLNFYLAFSLRERAILMSRFLFVTNIAITIFLGIFIVKVLQLIL